MNHQPNAHWAQTEYGGISETDFANLVELDLDMDMTGLDFQQQIPQMYTATAAGDAAKLDQPLDLSMLHDPMHQQQLHHHNSIITSPLDPHPLSQVPSGDMFDFNMQIPFDHDASASFVLPHSMQHIPSTHGIIPPTPNSVEMHGDAARYLQQLDAQSRILLEQQYQLRKGNSASFTPLVSPAVTPHESRLQNLVDYGVPHNAAFSPLTSPALEGQPQLRNAQGSASSVTTASPIDLDIDMGEDPTSLLQRTVPARRTRKRAVSPRLAASTNRVKQSPITKPMSRKKSVPSTVIPPREVQQILDQASSTQLSPTSPAILRISSTSGSDSVSPEPSTDSVMGPPPKPISSRPSPALTAQHHLTTSPRVFANGKGAPATPASLMRLHSHDSASPLMSPLGQSMSTLMSDPLNLEELALPEAATPHILPSNCIDPDLVGESTPRITARKTPKLAAQSTPGSAALSANTGGKNTPLASAVATPIASTPSSALGRKSEVKGGRGHKKRGSVSGTSLVSPAIRPKISPSIKPLLPEGATPRSTDEAHTIFLASRSNYQNLIEGTHVPGVNYPTELSTNLTSKRTSHKLAEQGRRNRINLALQEMLSLLPRSANGSPSILEDDEDEKIPGSGGKGAAGTGNGGIGNGTKSAAATGSSKAATVESAIEYIKTLQRESLERTRVVEEKEKEVEELRKRLSEMERKVGLDKGPGEGKGSDRKKNGHVGLGIDGGDDMNGTSSSGEESMANDAPPRNGREVTGDDGATDCEVG